MSKRLKVSMVSYLNSKPFILGMELAGLLDEIELHLEVPSKTAEKLIQNDVDLALVPVAVLPSLPHHQIVTNYCIGAQGKVDSVYLFSDLPIEKIQIVHLDSHSRTSGNLVKVLMKDYWKKNVHFIENSAVHENLVEGSTACLMIGDKAIRLRNQFAYRYDLAEAWKKMTGLPFAFAVWVTAKPLPNHWEDQFNEAFKTGLEQVHKIVPFYENQFPDFDIQTYLTNTIQFNFSKEKARALDLFLSKMRQIHQERKLT